MQDAIRENATDPAVARARAVRRRARVHSCVITVAAKVVTAMELTTDMGHVHRGSETEDR